MINYNAINIMEDKDFLKYLDLELYNVETDSNGKKRIHVDGYCYWNGESYQCVQACGCYLSIDELNCDFAEIMNQTFENAKQYQGDVTEDKVRKYYEGAKELRMEFVCDDTPDGLYVNY